MASAVRQFFCVGGMTAHYVEQTQYIDFLALGRGNGMSWLKNVVLALMGLVMTISAVTAAPMRVEHQIDILAQSDKGDDGWFIEPTEDKHWDKWRYAVTDLNHDGNLEILKAKPGFYDGTPRLECEELLERKWDRHRARVQLAGSAHVPDILTGESAGQPGVVYDEQNKRYYYIFIETIMRGEFESDTNQYAVCLDEDLYITELATMNWQLSGKDGTVKVKHYISDPLKMEVSEERYLNITKERFPRAKETGGQIYWLSAEELWPYVQRGKLYNWLWKFYEVFIGKGR